MKTLGRGHWTHFTPFSGVSSLDFEQVKNSLELYGLTKDHFE